MATISIIGKGNMAKGLQALFTRGGHTVTLLGRDDLESAPFGDIVVLAVPYGALSDIAAHVGAKLAGKVVVDITNPVDFATMSPLKVEAGSAAQELQQLLPQAHVVKAFNTTFAATLATGKVGDNEVTALVASDDDNAKQAVIDAVQADPHAHALNAGSLERAQQLETLGFLQISLAATEQLPWTGGFAVVR